MCIKFYLPQTVLLEFDFFPPGNSALFLKKKPAEPTEISKWYTKQCVFLEAKPELRSSATLRVHKAQGLQRASLWSADFREQMILGITNPMNSRSPECVKPLSSCKRHIISVLSESQSYKGSKSKEMTVIFVCTCVVVLFFTCSASQERKTPPDMCLLGSFPKAFL